MKTTTPTSMPTCASTERPGPCDQLSSMTRRRVLAAGRHPADQDHQARGRDDPPERQGDDPGRGAAERGVLPGDQEGQPGHDGERAGDRVQVEQSPADLEAARDGVLPGQAEPGQDDDDGREGGQEVDDDLGRHVEECALRRGCAATALGRPGRRPRPVVPAGPVPARRPDPSRAPRRAGPATRPPPTSGSRAARSRTAPGAGPRPPAGRRRARRRPAGRRTPPRAGRPSPPPRRRCRRARAR